MTESTSIRRRAVAEKSSTIPTNGHHNGRLKVHGLSAERGKNLPCAQSYLLIAAFLTCLILVARGFHYSLPDPVVHPYDANGEAVFAEANAREYIRVLSEDIGYRIVGTFEEERSKKYIVELLNEYKQQAQAISNAPKFEIDVQTGSGSHRFDMMGKVVMKVYTGITNIVVRLSCGPECDKNAVLVNSHFDSALSSPGASDDGAGVAVMLEVIRVMSQRPVQRKNAVIFLFNGAEESLQDASHHFITTHPWKDAIRGVVNLEACGQYGREILFQANSLEMIKAYQKVPRPHGTVTANDIFRTGLILSDTDFRQFVDYGNLTGLDLALYKNSYFYHTHLDALDSMTPGSLQHMGENSLALLEYLSTKATLKNVEKTTDVIYYDMLGKIFLVYQFSTAQVIHAFIVALVITLISRDVASNYDITMICVGVVATAAGFIFSVLAPVAVATIFVKILGKSMLWFSNEAYAMFIYGPSALAGTMFAQLLFLQLFPKRLLPVQQPYRLERTMYLSSVLFWTIGMAISTYFRIASSYMFCIYTITFVLGLLMNDFILGERKSLHLSAYIVAQTLPAILFGDGMFSLLDLFIPLMGRVGVEAPVEYIVAILCGLLTSLLFPATTVFSHRFGKRGAQKAFAVFAVISTMMVVWFGIYPGVFPYDKDHPKRVFIQLLANQTAKSEVLYVAHADSGPFETPIIQKLENELTAPAVFQSHHEDSRHWDTIYPFSQFLESYKFDFPLPEHNANGLSSVLSASHISYDHKTGLRSVSIVISHPALVWTVASFTANVTSWSIDDSEPFSYPQRYVVKAVSGWNSEQWRLDLTYVAAGVDDRLRVEFSGLQRDLLGRRGWTKNERLKQVDELMPDWTARTFLSCVHEVSYV